MISPSNLRPRHLLHAAVLTTAILLPLVTQAEDCITQSALAPADRAALADAAHAIAAAVQANDAATLRASSTPDIQRDFGALQYMVAVTSPKLAGATPNVEQLYVLDATPLKPNTDGSNPEAQFYCSLNKTTMEADFAFPALPPGRYAFVMVSIAAKPIPWRLSMLLSQTSGKWLLAGIYPKPVTLAGHDGLWYWTQARQFAQAKQQWDAWLYYQAAMNLLRPADFVLSTHLDKLHTETTAATPPALSEGISPQSPLVLKSPAKPTPPTKAETKADPNAAPATPSDLHFVALAVTDSAASDTPILAATLHADALTDPAAARQRNTDAAQALLTAYPELRKPFHSIAITTESPGQPPLATEIPIADLH